MKIFILGANGFIGSHLCEALLTKTSHEMVAIDIRNDQLQSCLQHARFKFLLGDMQQEKTWVKQHIQESDLIVLLAAIATPGTYVKNPLRIFELDFEANLEWVRACVEFKKRLLFPSSSEVYGMCQDAEFDEEQSYWATGPVQKSRWIYANCKQLLERLIFAYGQEKKLSFTLFRPFNWYGPRLDNVHQAVPASARVLTQFIGNILRGENIALVDGGAQKRCFTFIEDGIAALLTMVENKNQCAAQRVFNIGNPQTNVSVRRLAEELIQVFQEVPSFAERAQCCQLLSVSAKDYYGEGYQDLLHRVPSIRLAQEHLHWQPKVSLQEGLHKTVQELLK